MLIFDRFCSQAAAQRFADSVQARFGLGATVFATRADYEQHDNIPVELFPPIVGVERVVAESSAITEKAEKEIIGYAGGTTGCFVGT